jgi:hypothetical protein
MKEYKLTYADEKPEINKEIIIGVGGEGVKSDIEGKESKVPFTLKDMQTMQNMMVRAIVSPSENDLPDGDILWVQHERASGPEPKPWRIKIIEEIEEEPPEVKVKPKMHIGIGKRRGDMLKTLLEKSKK